MGQAEQPVLPVCTLADHKQKNAKSSQMTSSHTSIVLQEDLATHCRYGRVGKKPKRTNKNAELLALM